MAVVKIIPLSEFDVRLELTQDEALALYAVVGRITGHSDNTRRKYTSRIYYALNEALKKVGVDALPDASDLTGELKFHPRDLRV